jgi:hypothetical protein
MANLKVDVIESDIGVVQIGEDGSSHCRIGDSAAASNLEVTGTSALTGAVTCASTIAATAPTFTGTLTGTTADFSGDVTVEGSVKTDTIAGDAVTNGPDITCSAVVAQTLSVAATSITVGGNLLAVATRSFGTFTYVHSGATIATEANGFGVSSITAVAGTVTINFTDLATTSYVVLLSNIAGAAAGDVSRSGTSCGITVTGDCTVSFIIIKA